MSTVPSATWQSEFGIDATHSYSFFARKEDIDSFDSPISYAHVVRRAFDLLELDGVWCDQNTPIVYFKVVDKIDALEISKLHRRFWNHGGAAILVIISPNEVQVYSGLAHPTIAESNIDQIPSFVTVINRASMALQEFLPSVESGEFFRKHAKSFDTNQRVDQSLLVNLQATREKLSNIVSEETTDEDLDAFLCRLVFTCYLFDREIIGSNYLEKLEIPSLPHLRDILGIRPHTIAKEYLYRLFNKLAQDFNGDLFSDDLDTESNLLSEDHLRVVEDFFRGTDVTTGQQAIWPYDFGVIPIETVSAIYEHFLKPSDKKQGAFYTPRFLAELVLDIALSSETSLPGLRFLDPACGSGIFLVGLFNRIAEEWKQKNPTARNDERARELMDLMRESLFGIDVNPTACRITAFSLYLAYLDQLTPRDIQDLQEKGNAALPRLVSRQVQNHENENIWCGDFFDEKASYPTDVDIIIGNPPWGKTAEEDSLPAVWCEKMQLTLPSKQIATAFMWKTTNHLRSGGRVCLILPSTILFEQVSTSIEFQKQFLARNTVDLILNLTDYQRFLFQHAEYPAIVLSYRSQTPETHSELAYWFPKFDWKVKNANVISISEYDRHTIDLESVLNDLDSNTVPKAWKQAGWATPRDIRLINRLSQISPLEDYVRGTREKAEHKPWLVAAGIEPVKDGAKSYATLELPTNLYLKTDSSVMRLFVLPDDCVKLSSTTMKVRKRSNKTTDIFQPPHVLITYGFTGIAYSDFAVAFHHAVRGIAGPPQHREILMFLAAYLRSSLARYYMFHTSSNWGIGMQVVSLKELLKIPFLWPTTDRQLEIIEEVSELVISALSNASSAWVHRTSLVDQTQDKIEILILEYFDILPAEQILIEDTLNINAPSFRPNANSKNIPSIESSSLDMINRYCNRLCSTLNNWSKRSNFKVVYEAKRSLEMGIALVVLEVTENEISAINENDWSILTALHRLQNAATTQVNTFELLRGVKVFEGNKLYIMKPVGKRYWTETSALNDADEIATAILMSPSDALL